MPATHTAQADTPYILCVQPPPWLAALLLASGNHHGMKLHCCGAPEQMAALAAHPRCMAAVLAIDARKAPGIACIRQLREARDLLPVLVLSDHYSTRQLVEAMNAGADECLPHTVSAEELAARLRARIRRLRLATRTVPLVRSAFGLQCELQHQTASWQGRPVPMPPVCFKILTALMEPPGKSRSRAWLERRLWNREPFAASNALPVAVNRLRKALKDAGVPVRIVTHNTLGYSLQSLDAAASQEA